MKKVVFCCPFLVRPTDALISSLEASIPLIESAGWTHAFVAEVGCPYISHARATALRKALDAKADAVVFLDYDLSWPPEDLLRLIEHDGDVVAGTYRYKQDEEDYMGAWDVDALGRPRLHKDGSFSASRVPAGFLKVTKEAIDRFMRAYPSLVYGVSYNPSIDLFNHGAIDGTWYGEDMAFSKRWIDCGGEIALIPDLNITHHSKDAAYPGNLHEFMLRQPGGSKAAE
jgi:glycosyltransferase involved in cell wall biosynthesis